MTKSKSVHAGATTASRTRTESQEREREDEESGTPAPGAYADADEIVVVAVCDAAGRLVELRFDRCREIPRLLMQIVALCVPYQPLLTRLEVRRAPLEGEALYEIGKFLPLSQLTDVCLDDSPVPQKNYRSLLEHERLRRLSLARCELDDADCAALAAALAHPLPASRNLAVLSLVSNAIADAGARALAEALRSNRALQHLNLAGNRVGDEGALALFRALREFPLTYEELTTKRRRYISFLRNRREVYLSCLGSLTAARLDRPAEEGARARRRTAPARRKSVASPSPVSVGSGPSVQDAVAARADAMAAELVGAHADPFALEETAVRDGYLHSLGNTALCFLNLAHNSLGYLSVAALADLLRYQAALVRKAGPGLLRVVLDGNPLPATCAEYRLIQDLLERAVLWKLSKSLRKVDKTKQSKGKLG